MKLNVIERPPVVVACRRHIGAYGPSLSTFWLQEIFPWLDREGLMHLPLYGMALDDPLLTPPESCRYDACVEIEDGYVASADVFVKTIPGGRYAVFGFKGKVEQIGAAMGSILSNWIPDEVIQVDNRPALTYFRGDAHYNPELDALQCDILIPVAYFPQR